ncbi:MAG: hypothetical protein FWC09_00955 [Lachnospiraceae bacterium]|nr:hypothetical protein [Lachnospiraceae bacterium]
MVIQHNIMAMNSNRMFGITNSAKAKSTEKLSSGYKINRAADDAAGLAISEKMRRQIRGLTQGTENAQYGVSLVQTMDGSMQEITDMLHRMNELVIKGMNDTLTDEDRSFIQMELDQLTKEISNVAERTDFNALRPLSNGEAEYTAPITKLNYQDPIPALSILSRGDYAFPTTGNEWVGINTVSITSPSIFDPRSTIGLPEFATDYGRSWESGDWIDLTLEFNVQIARTSATALPANSGVSLPLSHTLTSVPQNHSLPTNIGGRPNIPATATSGLVTYYYLNTPPQEYIYPDVTIIAPNGDSYTWNGSQQYSNPSAVNITPNPGSPTFDWDVEVSGPDSNGNLNFKILPDKFIHSNDPSINPDCGDHLDINNFEGEWKLEIHNNAPANQVDLTYTQVDWASVETPLGSNNYEWIQQGLATNMSHPNLAQQFQHAEYQHSLVNSVDSTYDAKKHVQGEGPYFIVTGSETNNGIYIDIYDCHAMALGLADLGGYSTVRVYTDPSLPGTENIFHPWEPYGREVAAEGLKLVKDAIYTLNSYRSNAGAQHNRLEHTIANNKNIIENTTAAESQIRDTDMATEMVKFANNNILAQAGQAMLAQANQLNQGVLALLQ